MHKKGDYMKKIMPMIVCISIILTSLNLCMNAAADERITMYKQEFESCVAGETMSFSNTTVQGWTYLNMAELDNV